MYEIEFYRLENGTVPVEIFLDGLDVKMRNKAVRSLELLEEFGPILREPNSKAMGDGLFELRIQFAGDITRVFYFFYMNRKIVLTNGFIKKSKKTPKAELALARKYKADYERRHLDE